MIVPMLYLSNNLKEKKRNININLAILPSHNKYTINSALMSDSNNERYEQELIKQREEAEARLQEKKEQQWAEQKARKEARMAEKRRQEEKVRRQAEEKRRQKEEAVMGIKEN